MKRIAKCVQLIMLVMVTLYPLTVYAEDNSNTTITIYMPSPTPTQEPISHEPIPESPTPKPAPKLYPTQVWQTDENGYNQIVKQYELAEGESPADIPREDFTMGGMEYTLTDIIKKEVAATNTRTHREVVTIGTQTNDTATVIKLFNQYMEYTSDDGYSGTLAMDISTLRVETAGTATSNYTISAKREYANLSGNDPSLVPKTVTENGRTLKLANITWQAASVATVDNSSIPSTYTAYAEYTGTGTQTRVTGYSATAEYYGEITKLYPGNAVYTAYFIGTPTATPTPDPMPMPEPEPVLIPLSAPIIVPTPEPQSIESEPLPKENKGNSNTLIIILIVSQIIIAAAVLIFIRLRGDRRVTRYVRHYM